MFKSLPKVLLASKSPRRQDLLREAGIDFQLINVEVEEDFPIDMEVALVPEFLAKRKAEAAIPQLMTGHVILAADSVVILDNVIYNKAETRPEAIEMISRLAGHKHLVITGVYLCDEHKSLGFAEHTYVRIDAMSTDEIEHYVDTQKPFDKAGAYGIQDWIGWTKVSRIEGSYANVMGLPVHRVYRELCEW
jgi:septum formation protein